jgi:soluble lytic murein transglycosylase-like protein
VTAAPRETPRRFTRAAAIGAAVILLLVVAAIVIVPDFTRRAPDLVKGVARDIWSLVGVRRVEGHAAEIRAAAAESGVDPCLLAAVMYAESRGQIDAVSSSGALGPFQLMPSAAGDAARKLGLPEPTKEDLLSDALLGARLSASHIAWLIRHEGPDAERVLVAYNAGRTKLKRWIDAEGGYEAWRRSRLEQGGSGTLAYARTVLEMRDRFRQRGEIAPPLAPLGGAVGDWTTGLPE